MYKADKSGALLLAGCPFSPQSRCVPRVLGARGSTLGKPGPPGLCGAGLWEGPWFLPGVRLCLFGESPKGEGAREAPHAGEGGGLPKGTPPLSSQNQLGSGTLMLTLPGTFSGRNGGAGLADPH